MDYSFEGPVLWSQIDANMHLRHSAYADFAAQARLNLLNALGLESHIFLELKLGPILFREELLYLREVHLNDSVKVTSVLVKCRPDGSRWSIRHEIFRSDGVKAAIINVDGAWINIEERKLTALPAELNEKFMQVPRSDDFVMEEKK
ncbi:acyl-CoA thioesterase [Chitinophagaceae bacterium MMS25-I14]